MKKVSVVCAWIVILAFSGLVYLSVGGKPVRTEYDAELQVRILQTKEDADCIILYQGTDAVMIDTGEAQDSVHIIQTLHEAKIERLDALILTHPDKDHIGGALAVLQEFPVDKVIHPYYDGEKEALEEIRSYCKERQIKIYYPDHVWEIAAGYVDLVIYPPQEKHYKKDNNYSLAVSAKHGEVNMFFAGDAMRKRSEELLAMHLPEVELYKVAYHGRAYSNSAELFETLHPSYAVVTSDTADEEIIKSAEKCRTRLLFSREAEICFVSDGKQLTLCEQDASETAIRQERGLVSGEIMA